jgi:hypothetical protein
MHILAFAKQTSGLPMKSSALTNFSPQNNVPSLKHMLQTLNMRRFLHSHPIPPQMNHELFCSANSYRTFQVQTIARFLRSMVVSSFSPEFKKDTDMCNSKLHIRWKPLISSLEGG